MSPDNKVGSQGKHLPRVRRRTTALRYAMSRQLEISLAILVLILAGNAFVSPDYRLETHYTPDPSFHLHHIFSRFLFLSFQNPGTDLYFKGRDDAYLIAFWVVLFWFLREASMRWLWEPLARAAGIRDKRSVVRFAEQGWTLLYYVVFWTLGVYIMQGSPYKNLDTKNFYIGYPHDALPALTKWYYLVQTSFWLQQIIVLNLEERRKDYWQMFAHHIITTTLMAFSYVLNWTRVGNAVLCLMDFVDILLPLAKLFVYTKKPRAADAVFAIFIVAWIITRNVLYPILLWSVIFELPRLVPYGWRPRDGYFNSFASHHAFCGLLLALQVLIVVWFTMICRVAYRAITGQGAVDDTRSEAGEESVSSEEEIVIEDGEAESLVLESFEGVEVEQEEEVLLLERKNR